MDKALDIILPTILICVIIDMLCSAPYFFSDFLGKRHYRQDQLNEDFSYKPKTITQWIATALHNTITFLQNLSITNPLTVASLFTLSTFYIIFIDYHNIITNDYIKNKITPILLELTINGIIVSGVIAFFENRAKNKDKESARHNGRKLLSRYILIISKYINKEDLRKLYNNPEYPYYLLNQFGLRSELLSPEDHNNLQHEIAKYSENIKESSVALAAILSQIGPEYVWLSLNLVRTIKSLCNPDNNKYTFGHDVIELLGSIIEIDELNFSGWKTKKNLQQLMNMKAEHLARTTVH